MSRRNAMWVLFWGLIFGGAVMLFARMNAGEIVRHSREADRGWILLTAGINLTATWFEALRWKLILACVKEELGVSRVFGATLAGIFGNTVMPFRLGDGFRAYYLARRARISFVSALSTVMLDFLINTVFFVVFALGIFLLYPFPLRHPVLILSALVIAGALILTGGLFPRHRFARWVRAHSGARISGRISRFAAGFAALRDAGILFHASTISVLLWGMKILMVWCMIRAYRLDLDFGAAAVIMVLTNVGIGLVSTPANLGGYELSTIAGLALFGVGAERSASFAVVFHAVEVIPVMVLGFLVVLFSGMRFRELRTEYRKAGNRSVGE